ncbi:PaaI family thioesterase [Acinetobacter pittii]
MITNQARAFDLDAFVVALQPPAIHTLLNGKLEKIQNDNDEWHASIQYQPRAEFANPMGHVQGGMICSMLDDAMGLFAMITQQGVPAATVTMSVSFLRPCQIAPVLVQVYFVRQGRNIFNIESIAYQQGKAVAKASAAFTPI